MAKSPDNLLVVLGATGNQGTPVLQYFAALPSPQTFRLRGITRNPSSPASQQLSALGVEMVKADLADVNSLRGAFEGATHIFANTDSNQHIFDAIKQPHILAAGQTPVSYAADLEMVQGRNIAEAAASTPTLQRLVWSSLTSPKKWSQGRFTKVSMFDVKSDIAELLASKPELHDKLSLLLVGFYASNMLKVPDLYGPKKQADGTFELALPMSGDIPVPLADLDADMGSWVDALFQAEPGTSLIGATESLGWGEWLRQWAQHNKVEARFRRASDEEYGSRIQGISEAVLEEFAFVEQYGLNGGDPTTTSPDELRRKGIVLRPSSIQAHIARNDWSSLL